MIQSKARQSSSTVDSLKTSVSSSSGYQTHEHAPPVGHWIPAQTGQPVDYHGIRDGPYMNSQYYQSPVSLRHSSAYPTPDNAGGQFGVGVDVSRSTAPPSDMDSSFGTEFTEDDLHANRLKGVVWPGMDIFDSATPDQKRKRNQRKDDAAVDLLKLTSETISPIETVWGPDGDLRKMRDIYASASDDGSPPSTPPHRRMKRSHSTSQLDATPLSLMKGDVGQDRSKRRRTGRLSAGQSRKGRQTKGSARATDKDNRKKNSDAPEAATDVEEAVYTLSGHRHKGSFNVFYESSVTSGNAAGFYLFDSIGFDTRYVGYEYDY